jgi:enoyl-CoA hydratase/carnithine racemase
MNAADAIYTGFADNYIPKAEWPEVIKKLEQSGNDSILREHSQNSGKSQLAENKEFFEAAFKSKDLSKIVQFLSKSKARLASIVLNKITKNCPIAMTYTIKMLSRLTSKSKIEDALDLEYRFTSRAQEYGSFQEGIRAAIIDKDRKPKWQFEIDAVPQKIIEDFFKPI